MKWGIVEHKPKQQIMSNKKRTKAQEMYDLAVAAGTSLDEALGVIKMAAEGGAICLNFDRLSISARAQLETQGFKVKVISSSNDCNTEKCIVSWHPDGHIDLNDISPAPRGEDYTEGACIPPAVMEKARLLGEFLGCEVTVIDLSQLKKQ